MFGRSRSLMDFDKFNAANQGLWGFIILLFSVKRRFALHKPNEEERSNPNIDLLFY